ncbi:MAG: efflux RND transporter periplasmic adaptor subunit [Hyphomonadaceae bacterium]
MSDAQRLRRLAPWIFVGALALGIVGAGGYWLGVNRGGAPASEAGREVLYWYDPMRPEVHFDEPGRSPFMDMDLVARYAGEAPADAGVRIDPGVVQNFGVRLATVERAALDRSATASGVIAFSERSLAVVQARASGFVERAYGRAVGDVVAAGAPLVDVRVPEWAAAQAEYLALRSSGGELAAAARRRLAMLGMSEALIARIEQEGNPRPVITISAPVSGAITALDIRTGMTIAQGAPIATINGLSPVWLVVSLPQADAGLARRGGRVSARLSGYPGETFLGSIESVLPAADAATRTVEVRIALDNRDGRLRPGMSAAVELSRSSDAEVLIVPAEAVIQTGRRSVVIVAAAEGRFVPTEITIGRRSGDRIEIRQGLSEGQSVVASGQFLIDSEASLSGALEQLEASAAQPPPGAAILHEAQGRITALGAEGVTIAHGPVASLRWPAMTMAFVFERADLARGLAVGETVTFRFRQDGSRYVIGDIRETETRR